MRWTMIRKFVECSTPPFDGFWGGLEGGQISKALKLSVGLKALLWYGGVYE